MKTIQIIRDVDNGDIFFATYNQEDIGELYSEYRVFVENNESYELSMEDFENWLLNEKEITLKKVGIEEIFI
jgi:hypothetical protein